MGQQGSMVVLQAEQQLSVVILQTGAAEVDYITIGRVVEVNYSAIGRQQGVGSNGSAVLVLGSNSRLNIRSLIYRLVIRL